MPSTLIRYLIKNVLRLFEVPIPIQAVLTGANMSSYAKKVLKLGMSKATSTSSLKSTDSENRLIHQQHQQFSADVAIKVGNMKKGRKGRKCFAVLKQDSYGSKAACIEFYESEKDYVAGKPCSARVLLSNVFNINMTVAPKIPFCIGIFGQSDSFYIGCATEDDCDAWFRAILGVFASTKPESYTEVIHRLFEYVWDVTLLEKDLGKNLSEFVGPCRLCLNNESIILYKRGGNYEDKYECPLIYMSEYSHNENTFDFRAGRFSEIGAGHIFLKCDEPGVAEHIHASMRKVVSDNHDLRLRSSSDSVSTRRGSNYDNGFSRSVSVSGQTTSSTLPQQRQRVLEQEYKIKNWENFLSQTSHRPRGKKLDSSTSSLSPSGGCSSTSRTAQSSSSRRGSISSMSSTSTAHPGNSSELRYHRHGSEAKNPLPVVQETGGSSSGGEYLPLDNPAEKSDTNAQAYLPMAASMSTFSSTPTYHLEEVRSYISDSGDSACSTSTAPRAYSVGSKPTAVSPPYVSGRYSQHHATPSAALAAMQQSGGTGSVSARTGAGVCSALETISADEDRRRAHSFGGGWQKRTTHRSSALQRAFDAGFDMNSRSNSFASSGRRLTNSSQRSDFSDDLVMMDFSPPVPPLTSTLSVSSSSAAALRSTSGSLSSSDSLQHAAGAVRFAAGMVEPANQSAARRYLRMALNEDSSTDQASTSTGGTTVRTDYSDYVPMDVERARDLLNAKAGALCSKNSCQQFLIDDQNPTLSSASPAEQSDYIMMETARALNPSKPAPPPASPDDYVLSGPGRPELKGDPAGVTSSPPDPDGYMMMGVGPSCSDSRGGNVKTITSSFGEIVTLKGAGERSDDSTKNNLLEKEPDGKALPPGNGVVVQNGESRYSKTPSLNCCPSSTVSPDNNSAPFGDYVALEPAPKTLVINNGEKMPNSVVKEEELAVYTLLDGDQPKKPTGSTVVYAQIQPNSNSNSTGSKNGKNKC